MPAHVCGGRYGLTRLRPAKRRAMECVNSLTGGVACDIERRHQHAQVNAQAKDPKVKQSMVQRAQGEGVGDLIGSLLAMPADMGRLDRHRIAAKGSVEAAHRAGVAIGAQDHFGEPLADVVAWP